MNRAIQRTQILTGHLLSSSPSQSSPLSQKPCLNYSPPELTENYEFDLGEMRKLLDGHNLEDRDWLFGLMLQSPLFNPRERGGKVFVLPDYNQSMEQQREMTLKRIQYLAERGVFTGWLTSRGIESELRMLAFIDVLAIFDHSLFLKLVVHFLGWGSAIKFSGTKIHHDKWLRDTENYVIKGCFAMSELGHGSNVRGIETVTTYDPKREEFVISTPCESGQKYWIGGAANHATHTVVFSQLNINGSNQGVHAFIAQIRDAGNLCPNIRIADCGHKIGLNGVDNGRIWFDNVRIPRENLLNSVADVTPDGKYLSAIKDPDQRFAAFLAPLTSGRVTIASCAVYQSKIGLAIAIRYSLTRRAFSVTPNGPEVLLLDYPSHQRRLLPLLAKTYAMSFAANYLKMIYVKRTPESNKTIHVVSCAFKAVLTWHNTRTLQECREACGGQGLKTENRVGHLKAEYDVQSTLEGDNNVLMQQVSKALLAQYIAARKRNKPFQGLGLEHMNRPCPVIPSQLTSSVLRCSQLQTNAFCLRERDLLNRFAAEVSQHQTKGENKENAFLLSYQLAEDLGRAFSDRSIFQTFIEAEETVCDLPLKNVLGLLRSMYVLICMEEDVAFLRYGYLSTNNAAAVRKEVTKLCSELRPHALGLVSSLGIPDAFLSPIAFNWVDANSWSSVKN
ncbi:Acyl-CoA_dh_1 domain-containing protein/ACOX domain-containing protein/Acyl-CoA_dh_M domain-containing protein [Cephalotus follicularis]|uniref:Acyl-coenzyme A oxidase n=1 Tax=Cephalotus follicularis TaxID=3775 RepID=A0A1Q3C7B0_CEPFO|nr:Acyl-CoA_dh_1 domain-containing protein/ACOX domain-containing protein/Acyl-CoA_dh_M domain-containing protein [Cephalotus follicularis]